MKLINLEKAIEYAKEKDYIKMSNQERALREVFALATVEAVQIDVLDKIRTEIDKWHHLTDKAFNDGIDTALEIIDKYKAESEE